VLYSNCPVWGGLFDVRFRLKSKLCPLGVDGRASNRKPPERLLEIVYGIHIFSMKVDRCKCVKSKAESQHRANAVLYSACLFAEPGLTTLQLAKISRFHT
jgi:hypothetical protein